MLVLIDAIVFVVGDKFGFNREWQIGHVDHLIRTRNHQFTIVMSAEAGCSACSRSVTVRHRSTTKCTAAARLLLYTHHSTHAHRSTRIVLAVQTFQRMIEPMLFERFQVSKLHAAHVAREEFVGWQPSAMILFAMFNVRGTIAIRLAALLTDKRFFIVTGTAEIRMLQCGMLLEQPDGRKGRIADDAARFFFDRGNHERRMRIAAVMMMMMILLGIVGRVNWRWTVVLSSGCCGRRRCCG